MTNLEALKSVLEALGGDPSTLDVTATNADVIAAIAEAIKAKDQTEAAPAAETEDAPAAEPKTLAKTSTKASSK